MDFRLSDDLKAFRAEVRAVLKDCMTPEAMDRAHATGTWLDWDLHAEFARRGWIGDDWPVELGGAGNDPLRMVAMREEIDLSGAPALGWIYARMIANCIRHSGTADQKATIIPQLLSGQRIICLGYTEPGCGSDVAAVTTRAQRDGDGWVINGQKIFTTVAEVASDVFLLTRTNPGVAKHKGQGAYPVCRAARRARRGNPRNQDARRRAHQRDVLLLRPGAGFGSRR